MKITKEDIKKVYRDLQNRDAHPLGRFDNAGRWFSDYSDMISVRYPSRRYPYSQMAACRTLKFLNALVERFDCKSIEELRTHAHGDTTFWQRFRGEK